MPTWFITKHLHIYPWRHGTDMTDIFFPLCHLTEFSARCAKSRDYQDSDYTLHLVIASATGMFTLPVWVGKAKPVCEGTEQSWKTPNEPVSAQRSMREWESLQKNESRYFIFQGAKKNKTFTTFFKSSSFKGTLAKINEDTFSQCTLDFASLHRCLPPSLILIHSTYNISFNSGTATRMRLLTSWRN